MSKPSSTICSSSRAKRAFFLIAIKILQKHRKHRSKVLFLSDNVCVKYTRTSEASSMAFVARNTCIPIPKIKCVIERKGSTYIVMERVRGKALSNCWDVLPRESMRRVLEQLKGFVAEMRSLAPGSLGVSNADGGPLFDMRIAQGDDGYLGPFSTVSDFHLYLRHGMGAEGVSEKLPPDLADKVAQLITLHQSTWALCFTHGDLNPNNILVDGDRIVAIIDWETAGWYPNYWEYTTAWTSNPHTAFWKDEVDKFLDPMPAELAMEKLRDSLFGDLGVQD